jgi:hypothetical protein
MSASDDLLEYIFDGKDHRLREDFADWLRSSRRFREFATYYRDKIRAKLRTVRDEGSIEDLAAELRTAALLLGEDRFTLEYERYAAAKRRGPDLTVTCRTHTQFNVEVRRIRAGEPGEDDAEARVSRLMGVLCAKVGQMPPSVVNLLWLEVGADTSESDLTKATATLRQLAESKVEDYFTRRGFESSADFVKQYHRLSAIVLSRSDDRVVWLNALARHRMPSQIVTAIQRLHLP